MALTRLERLNQWLTLVANLGVVAGLIFLTLEVRTNTEANQIAIYQSVSENWMELNRQLAQDRELVEMLEKAQSGAELDAVEARRFEGWVRQHLTHASFTLRLYAADLLDESRLRANLRDIRALAQNGPVRRVIEDIVTDGTMRTVLLDQDGLDWLVSQ